jgi:hypothetical protein
VWFRFHGSLQQLALADSFHHFNWQLCKKDWGVYTKPSFVGVEYVLNYLARDTHRVAISNHRLVIFENDRVSFRWRDYAHGGKKKVMTASADEFLRRFLIHVLPKGLVRIRHAPSSSRQRVSMALRLRLVNRPKVGSVRLICAGRCHLRCPAVPAHDGH